MTTEKKGPRINWNWNVMLFMILILVAITLTTDDPSERESNRIIHLCEKQGGVIERTAGDLSCKLPAMPQAEVTR